MPQSVEIPDQGVVEFPDSMSPDEIKGVIQKKFYSGKATSPAPTASTIGSLGESIGKVLGKARDIGTEALSAFSPEASARIFGQTSASLRPEQISGPLISPENAQSFVGELPAALGGHTEIGKGLAEGAAGQLSEVSRPSTLAQLLGFALPGVEQTYALNTAADVPKQIEGIRDTIGKHGLFSKETGKALAEAGIADVTGLFAGRSVAKAGKAGLGESINSLFRREAPKPEEVVPSGEEIQRQDETQRQGEEGGLLAAEPDTGPGPVKDIVPPGGGSAVAQGDLDALAASNAARLAEGMPAQAVQPIVPEGETPPEATGTGPQVISTAFKDPETGQVRVPPADMPFIGHEGVSTYHEQPAPEEPARGFLGIKTEGGPVEFLTREEAAKVAVENGEAPPGTTELKSEHYQANGEPLYKAPQTAATSVEATAPIEKPPGKRISLSVPSSPTGVPDLIDFVNEQGGVHLPKKGERTSLHEDVTEAVEKFYAGKLANPQGAIKADEMAQMAYDAGLLKLPPGDETPTASDFWRAFDSNIAGRQKIRSDVKGESRQMKQAQLTEQKQAKSFEKDVLRYTPKKEQVNAADLQVGDSLIIGGEEFKVGDYNSDTDKFTIDGGKKYGTQEIARGQLIYPDSVKFAERTQEFQPAGFEPSGAETQKAQPVATQAAVAEEPTVSTELQKGISEIASDLIDFIQAQAAKARESLGPGAASTSEFPILRAETAREYATIGAGHLLEGAGDRAAWDTAMREEYGIRDATPTELNQIWRDSHTLLADFTAAQSGEPLPVKTQIERATGIRPSLGPLREQMSNSVTKARAFGEYLRGLQKGSKIGSESQREQLAIADRLMAADQEMVRASLTDFVNVTLPPKERGRFITAIGRALRRSDLLLGDPETIYRNAFRVMQAIENRAVEVYKGSVIDDIKTTVKRSLESPSVDIEYQKRIREAMTNIGTTKPIASTIESMKKLNAYIEQLQANGEEVSADMLERVSGLSKVPLKDLTIPALESLRTKLVLLEKLGRANVKSRQITWLRERAGRVAQMKGSISTPLETNPIFKPQPGERGQMTLMQRVGNWFNAGGNSFHGFERAIAPMDEIYDLLGASKGTYDGWLERNIRGPLDLAYNAEVYEGTPLRAKAQEIIDRNNLSNDDLETIQVHGISKMEGGKERLADMDVSDKTVDAAQTLTTGQKEFYYYVRSVYDSILPRIQQTAHALDNKEVKGVENYVPLQRDWAAHAESDVSTPGEITFDENATSRQVLNDIGATRLSTKAKQGFTIERVKGAVTAVRLNAADIFNRHLSDALHYIHAQGDLRMAGQIARSPAFAEKFGKAGQQIILDHLDTIARQGGVNRFQRLAALDWVRNATSKAQVGFRVASNLVHLSQIPYSIMHAGGPGYWTRGMRATLSEEGQAFIRANAAETTVRSGGEPAQAEAEAISKFSKAGFAVARNIDRLDAQATFLGRYFKEMEKKGVTPDQALSMPVDIDAQMVSLVRTRRAVASPLYKDIPQSTSRGLGFGGNVSVARAVNQFRNIFFDNWSNIRHDFFRGGLSDAVKNGLDGDNASKLAAVTAVTLMSIAAETGIKYGIKSGISSGIGAITGAKEAEDKGIIEDFKHHVLNRIPFVGQAINAAIYGETGVPVIDAAVKPLHEIATAVKSKTPATKLKHELRAGSAAATVLGVPGIGQAADIAEKVIVPKAKKKNTSITIE